MSNVQLYPLVFEPRLKARVWGGRALTRLGKTLPGEDPIGESWEVCDLEGEQSVVANGRLAGCTLGELVSARRQELLGDVATDGGRFPLLVKYIDAARDLSLQVHPDESVAAELGGRAKNEAWYILHAEPGAKLYLGLKPGITEAEYRQAISAGTLESLLLTVEPKVGDLVPVRPGTVHAIGAGVVLAEVQQPSDTTYRIYDWGRLGLDGKPRQLHIEESVRSTKLGAKVEVSRTGHDAGHFKIDLRDGAERELNGRGPLVVVTLGGNGRVMCDGTADVDLSAGRVALVPACCRQDCRLAGDALRVMLVTFPQERKA